MQNSSQQLQDGQGFSIELIDLIGCGAFGKVFKALRCAPDGAGTSKQVVAVKEITFDNFSDEPSDLLKEVSIMANMRSPFIVQYVSSFFHEQGSTSCVAGGGGSSMLSEATLENRSRVKTSPPLVHSGSGNVQLSSTPAVCIVQEFIEGGTLSELLAVQRQSGAKLSISGGVEEGSKNPTIMLSEEQASSIIVDVLHALVYLHEDCRIVHRDIKSSNILLSVADGRCRLCDFGTGGRKNTASEQRLTMIGTPGWMAPEVWAGATSHSFGADIWTLGVTVVEMCMRTAPTADPLFSQYVQFISQMPCSFCPGMPQQEPTFLRPSSNPQGSHGGGIGGKAKFSAIDGLINSPLLLDFVACCLRRDPQSRPSARDLLSHPILIENGVTSTSTRKLALIKRMADQLLTERLASSQQNAARSRSANSHAGTAKNALPSLSRVFLHHFDSAYRRESPATFEVVVPPELREMWSSESYKALSSMTLTQTSSALCGSSSSTTAAASATTGTAASMQVNNSVFNQVIAPAIIGSRTEMQRIFSVHRSVGMTGRAGASAATGGGDMLYSVDELQSKDLTFDAHERRMNKLLKALHAVEHIHSEVNNARAQTGIARSAGSNSSTGSSVGGDSAAPTSQRFCEWFTSFLFTNEEDATNVSRTVAYFNELHKNPFHHHHAIIRPSQQRRVGLPSTLTAGQPSLSTSGTEERESFGHVVLPTSGFPLRKGSKDDVALNTTNSVAAAIPTLRETVMKCPYIPCERLPTDTLPTATGSATVDEENEAKRRSGCMLRDPSAYLFNAWLHEQKQHNVAL